MRTSRSQDPRSGRTAYVRRLLIKPAEAEPVSKIERWDGLWAACAHAGRRPRRSHALGAPARRAAQAAPSPHLLQHSPPPPRLLSRRSKLVGRRQINQRRSQCHMRAAERTCRPAADPCGCRALQLPDHVLIPILLLHGDVESGVDKHHDADGERERLDGVVVRGVAAYQKAQAAARMRRLETGRGRKAARGPGSSGARSV